MARPVLWIAGGTAGGAILALAFAGYSVPAMALLIEALPFCGP